ncbi:Hdac6 [Scenedesmus sp. PABB004]|nr:Hdac6 [Scenedesmus sp. PABB004]
MDAPEQLGAAAGPPPAPGAAAAPAQQHARADKRVGIVFDAVMELHLREGHPEHPNRVRELNARLEGEGLLERCARLSPARATDAELLACHSRAHVDKVEGLYGAPITAAGLPAARVGDAFIISGDIFCNAHTAAAARSAAGCAAQAVRAVLTGEVEAAFAVVRPPGHHAESEALQGFCFYNNVAVAARAALARPGVRRVAVVDWDVRAAGRVLRAAGAAAARALPSLLCARSRLTPSPPPPQIHHGNGTQQIFEADPAVLVLSIHRRDKNFYPQGCGYAGEVGTGPGRGFNVNVPWPCKGMGDADYDAALELLVDPILASFAPDLVIISAGFDAAAGDFLGQTEVSPAGFAAMTARLAAHAGGKLVAVLEGGYVPSLVGECAAAVLRVMLGEPPPPPRWPAGLKLHARTRGALSAVDAVQRDHWPALAAAGEFEARFAIFSTRLRLEAVRLGAAAEAAAPRAHGTRGAAAAAAAATAAAAAGEAERGAAGGGGGEQRGEGPASLAAAAAAAGAGRRAAAAAAARKAAAEARRAGRAAGEVGAGAPLALEQQALSVPAAAAPPVAAAAAEGGAPAAAGAAADSPGAGTLTGLLRGLSLSAAAQEEALPVAPSAPDRALVAGQQAAAAAEPARAAAVGAAPATPARRRASAGAASPASGPGVATRSASKASPAARAGEQPPSPVPLAQPRPPALTGTPGGVRAPSTPVLFEAQPGAAAAPAAADALAPAPAAELPAPWSGAPAGDDARQHAAAPAPCAQQQAMEAAELRALGAPPSAASSAAAEAAPQAAAGAAHAAPWQRPSAAAPAARGPPPELLAAAALALPDDDDE